MPCFGKIPKIRFKLDFHKDSFSMRRFRKCVGKEVFYSPEENEELLFKRHNKCIKKLMKEQRQLDRQLCNLRAAQTAAGCSGGQGKPTCSSGFPGCTASESDLPVCRRNSSPSCSHHEPQPASHCCRVQQSASSASMTEFKCRASLCTPPSRQLSSCRPCAVHTARPISGNVSPYRVPSVQHVPSSGNMSPCRVHAVRPPSGNVSPCTMRSVETSSTSCNIPPRIMRTVTTSSTSCNRPPPCQAQSPKPSTCRVSPCSVHTALFGRRKKKNPGGCGSPGCTSEKDCVCRNCCNEQKCQASRVFDETACCSSWPKLACMTSCSKMKVRCRCRKKKRKFRKWRRRRCRRPRNLCFRCCICCILIGTVVACLITFIPIFAGTHS